MTLKHTMTLTDREANLLHKWAKKELEKDDAVAAAWVLNGLIENHIQKWVENKWERESKNRVRTPITEPGYTVYDTPALAEMLAPVLEKDTNHEPVPEPSDEWTRQLEKDTIIVACRDEQGQGRVDRLYVGSPAVAWCDYAIIWNASDTRMDVYKALCRDPNMVHYMADDEIGLRKWMKSVGKVRALQRLSAFTAKLRKAGVPMKKMTCGRRKPQVDDSARSTRT